MLTSAFTVQPVKAVFVERKVGVNVGDWVEYKNYTFSWKSNVPFDELGNETKSFIKNHENLYSLKVTVLDVSGTMVNYESLLRFKNGTEWATQTFVDVETGSGSNMFFIASNLSAGHSIYTNYPDWIISETFQSTYLGESREVNILFGKTTSYKSGPYIVSLNFTIIWDRLTGILLEWYGSVNTTENINKTVTYHFHLTITGTSRWGYRIWIVDDDGPADFQTIQEAINHANEGDTIFVRSGVYNENVLIDKTLSLIGESENTTIISGREIYYKTWGLVTITASNVNFSRFAVYESSMVGMAIFLKGVTGCNISHNILKDHEYGIVVVDSYKNFISDNIIENCKIYGITLYGIHSSGSPLNTLRRNKLTKNSYNLGVYGRTLSDFIQDIDVSNVVDDKPVYYLVNQSNKQVPVNAGYVAVVNSTNIVIANVTISNSQGILFAYAGNSVIQNANVSGSIRGVYLINSKNNVICRNIFSKNLEGIRLEYSDNNQIMSNNITYNYDIGLMLEESSANLISENLLKNNFDAVDLSRSNFNKFYHNNFINNTYQVHHVYLSSNVWDDGYPAGGNYWSDYAGIDLYSGPCQNETGSDGIGDTPYVIDENNIDHYPLINPWTPKPVITSTVNIKPDVLNLGCRGIWVTAYVELPEGYNVSDINPTTLVLNNTILIDLEAPVGIGDYDNDTIPDLMVKFNRATVCNFILSKGIRYGNVTFMLSGKLYDGTLFEGYDTIRVRMPGDINMDGKVDMKDISIACRAFGSYPSHLRWNPIADENEDNKIDTVDIALICRNFGKTY